MGYFNQLFQAFLSSFKGGEGDISSKRMTLFWIAGPIWGFVNVAVFIFHGKFGLPNDLPATVVLYDFLLICGFGGLTVYEKLRSKSIDNQSVESPKDEKAP